MLILNIKSAVLFVDGKHSSALYNLSYNCTKKDKENVNLLRKYLIYSCFPFMTQTKLLNLIYTKQLWLLFAIILSH